MKNFHLLIFLFAVLNILSPSTNAMAVGPTVGILGVSPKTNDWQFLRNPDGSYTPTSQDLVFTNTGAPLTFSLTGIPSWYSLTSSISGGSVTDITLNYLDSVTITVAINTEQADLISSTTSASFSIDYTGEGPTSYTVKLSIPIASPSVLLVDPAESFFSTGVVGGPFDPVSKDFTVSNDGGSDLHYTIAKTQNWFDISSSGGTLAPGDSTTVTFSLNTNADKLTEIDTYTDTVTFTNTDNTDNSPTRTATLVVTPTPPGVLEVTPTDSFLTTGYPGGPFTPSSKDYSLKNTGGDTIEVTVGNTETWVTLSSAGTPITLNPDESTIVTVSINSAANALPDDNYSDTVVFTNTTNGNGSTTRPVSLLVNIALTASLTLTPSDDYLACGPEVGPFTPSSMTYTVTNSGTAGMSFSASATAGWLTVLPTSGELSPGDSTIITVSIDTQVALTLGAGTFTDTLTFTNNTDNNGSTTRAVTLYVELPYGVLVVSPIDDFIATGISSGPFSPASKTYTLSNFGGATLDFSVTKNAAWLDLSTISDSIPGYDSTTVTLTLNTEAEKLLFGNYTDTITFSNDIDATQDATRLVDLTVERKPVSWGMFLPAIINGKK